MSLSLTNMYEKTLPALFRNKEAGRMWWSAFSDSLPKADLSKGLTGVSGSTSGLPDPYPDQRVLPYHRVDRDVCQDPGQVT
jgi:hypothetical protein